MLSTVKNFINLNKFGPSLKSANVICLLLTLMFIAISTISLANTSNQTFDDQRPEQISDKKWSSLKTAVQEAKLLPTPAGIAGAFDQFGSSVSVDGDRAIIAANRTLNHGVVYIMDFIEGKWEETQVLIADDSATADQFGYSVSLSGDRALVGAHNDDDYGDNSGSAYVFDFNSSTGIWSQTVKILPTDGAGSDNFGYSVSLSGDRALIGAHNDDDNGTNSGSAHVFDFNASTGIWSQVVKLLPTDGASYDNFGYSVSLSGDRALIGAIGNYTAYVFDLNIGTGTWSQSSKLLATDGARSDLFGYSVSLSGDRALVGAHNDDDYGYNSGSAYVFDFNSSTGIWSQTVKILPTDGADSDNFGYSVSLSGDRALIGARGIYSAYVFDLDTGTGTCSQSSKLQATDGVSGDFFGHSVSLSGDRALIGAKFDDDNGAYSGSAYVFDLNTGTGFWSQAAKLLPTEGARSDKFGYSLSLSGHRALIGAKNDGDFSGSAYVFDFDLETGLWSQVAKLLATDSEANDLFGSSVSLSGDRALIGAVGDDDNGSASGSAYVFELDTGTGLWSQAVKLLPTDGIPLDVFGKSVSLSGDRMLIGAGYRRRIGSAYVFDLDTGTGAWSQSSKLLATDGRNRDLFGYSVSLSGDRALIGAYQNDDNGISSGSAYVFDLNAGTGAWSQASKLLPIDGEVSDNFGYSVSLSGGRALIGTRGNDSAYIFDLNNGTGTWSQVVKLLATDSEANDQFGYSVSLSGDRALIGAVGDDDNGTASGSAYVFELDTGTGLWSQSAKLLATDGEVFDGFGYSVSLSNDRVLIGSIEDDDRGADSGSAYIINLNKKFSIGGNIIGLASGNTVELENNSLDTQSFANGVFTFVSELAYGASYDVKVSNSPTTPNQACVITGGTDNNGTGTIDLADVTDIAVSCTITKYDVNVTVNGLAAGNTIDVSNDGVINTLSDVNTQTSFNLDDGAVYAVTATNATIPNCTVIGGNGGFNNGEGVLAGADVAIIINCNSSSLPPTAVINTYTAFEDVTLSVNDANGSVIGVNDDSVLVNDSDVDGDTLFVVNPGTFNANGIAGQITIATDGTFSYVPPADVFGTDMFDFSITDGIHTVTSSLTIEVLPVNDAPSFEILGNVLSAELHPDIVATTLTIADFAYNLDAGAPNENIQTMQFTLTIFADSNDVMAANGFNITNNGDMTLEFTSNIGVAILRLTLKDNGLTPNSGEDTSTVAEFVVSYIDTVYMDGFEDPIVIKLFNNLDTFKSKSPLSNYPIYDIKNDSINYNGHSLKLYGNAMNLQMMDVVKLWVDEVAKAEVLK